MTNQEAQVSLSTPSVRERIGYRGLVLLWCGSIAVVFGLAIGADTSPVVTTLPHTFIPLHWRMGLWIVAGAAGLFAGIMNLWTTRWQIPAFVLLIIPPAQRAISYTIAAFLEYPSPDTAHWYGAIPGARAAMAVIFWQITIGLMIFARWPEPTPGRADGPPS